MLFGHNGIASKVFRTRKSLAAQGTGGRDTTDVLAANRTGRTEQATDKRSRQDTADRTANARKGRTDRQIDGAGLADGKRQTSITARPEA